MATEEQLLAGLKAADAAGNTADAQHFADQIKAMRAPGVGGTLMDMIKGAWGGAASNLNPFLSNNPLNQSENDPQYSPLPGAETMKAIPGSTYQPKTPAGRYAQLAGQFTPALAGGEASLIPRVLGRVLAPAAGAQMAGSFAPDDSPNLRAALQTGGAVLGGLGAGGVRAGAEALGSLGKGADPAVTGGSYVRSLADGQTPNIVANKGQTIAEALGQKGVAAAATLARRPGDTGQKLADLLSVRAADAPNRMLSDFASASGIDPEAASGNMESIVKKGRASVAPLYTTAENAPPATTDYLSRFAQDPDVKKGIAIGVRNAQREALANNVPFDPNAYAINGFDAAGDPIIKGVPTWKTWDAAKNGLDEMLESYRNPITKNLDLTKTGYAIDQVRRSLLKELDSVNPAYGAARASSADYLSANSAFKAAQQHILSPSVTVNQVEKYVADLSPANLEAYKGGIANAVFNKAQNGRLTPRLLNTPATQGKLVAVLGPDKAQTFLQQVGQEADLAKSGARMMPGTGSITSNVLLNSGEQDQAANLAAALQGAKAVGYAATGRPVGAAMNAVEAVRHFVPDFLKTGGMNEAARNKAGELLSMPSDQFQTVLQQIQQSPQKKKLLATLLSQQ